MNARQRKRILVIAGVLAAVYLVWLIANVMKFLPEGLVSAWYTGFAVLGLATAMALVALRRPQEKVENPAQKPKAARPSKARPTPQAKGTVFNPSDTFMQDEADPAVAPPFVPPVPHAFTQSPDSTDRIRAAGFDMDGHHTPAPVWNVHDTNEQLPVPSEAESISDPFVGYKAPARSRTAVMGSPAGLMDAAPQPPEDIHVMSSYAEPSYQNEAEEVFSNAAASSIEDAIKRYTFDLYDIGEDEFTDALQSINPNDSGLGLGRAPANPSQHLASRSPNAVKARLEKLRNKLGGPAPPEPVLASSTAPDLAAALTGMSPNELPDLFSASNFSPQESASALEPFKAGLGSMSRDEVNRLWQDYVALSRRCGRDVHQLNPESFKAQLVHNHKAICQMFQCSAVSFHVKLKNGKPSLSARPA